MKVNVEYKCRKCLMNFKVIRHLIPGTEPPMEEACIMKGCDGDADRQGFEKI